ncbi:EthD domain-containing protein [Novosphingobium sp. MMS21-SN21R]|uniref:EthD domain-containing protein n=1 Tax=Novosphingobium sp. MMS21-SN21R TaxID=2969298 RepID=UPI00288752B7|nr:EthD domain-containing protein [Novosphingobium sp. MMS21-SN21R]MDT0510233.1 EthD domain-containing protein [Novosphingobium sp. MMS21-SN21R]
MTPVAYKIALLLRRDPGLDRASFVRQWLEHTSIPPLPQLLSRRFSADAGRDVPIENVATLAYDGVDELVFESRAGAEAGMADPALRQWLDARRVMLSCAPDAISGTAVPIWARDADRSHAVKIFTLPIRRAGMTMDSFASHWIDRHAGLALAGPCTRERLLCLESTPADRAEWHGLTTANFDGIGVIMFDSPESLAAEFASDHYRTVMAPDEPRFTDPQHSRALMMQERLCNYFTSG